MKEVFYVEVKSGSVWWMVVQILTYIFEFPIFFNLHEFFYKNEHFFIDLKRQSEQ